MIDNPTPTTRSQQTAALIDPKDVWRGSFRIVWVLLIAATLVSWYLGADQAVHDHRIATTLILLVAFIKVRFVGLYFMELRDAPHRLRLIFEAHCLIVCTAMLGVYLAS